MPQKIKKNIGYQPFTCPLSSIQSGYLTGNVRFTSHLTITLVGLFQDLLFIVLPRFSKGAS